MFWYAAGPYRESTATAGSGFSKGQLLCWNASSQLSELNLLGAVTTSKVAGVAICDSTKSIANQVPYVEANEDTIWFADIQKNIASQFTAGLRLEVIRSPNATASRDTGNHVVYYSSSATTARVAIVGRGDYRDVQQTSDQSVVMVKLLSSAAELAIN